MSQDIQQQDAPLAKEVEAALQKMASDKRLKRNVMTLAKLVGVSRGTLYNHSWVGARFRKFKVEQEEKKATDKRPRKTALEFDAEKSDREIMLWKRKCDALAQENENLKSRIESLRRQLGGDGAASRNVVPISKGPRP